MNDKLRIYWNNKAKIENEREKNPIKQVHTDITKNIINDVISNRKKLKILDAGAGTGRFSIWLALMGHSITHFDISDEMIRIAKEQAENINNIEFIKGSINNLEEFSDNQFDIVLSLDSPISFCQKTYKKAVSELVRVSHEYIVVCVMSRISVIFEGGINFDLEHYGELKTVLDVYKTGDLNVNDELLSKKDTLMPSWHAFNVDELIDIFESFNCKLEKILSPASVARFIDKELLLKLIDNEKSYKEFLKFEERIDSDKSILGVGNSGAGGLLAVFKKNKL